MRHLGLMILASACVIEAAAVLGTPDAVPAATLLLPYFEVNLEDESGMTTIISINNASAAAALAHVTLWTNAAVPTATFDVMLTGFDVATFNLRDLFSDAAADPGLSTSKARLRAAHTGEPNPETNLCSGFSYGDTIVRGYLTVDHVNEASLLFPSDPGYFSGVASDSNVLWGDYFYVDLENNFAQGELLVHIEASSAPEVTTPGNATFYGRYVNELATDHREPLPRAWATGYDLRGDSGTHLTYWRDTRTPQVPFPCGVGPAFFPLPVGNAVAFDDAENADGATPAVPMGEACGRIDLSQTPIAFDFGWLYLNLAFIDPEPTGGYEQAYVTVLNSSAGRFSRGQSATVLE